MTTSATNISGSLPAFICNQPSVMRRLTLKTSRANPEEGRREQHMPFIWRIFLLIHMNRIVLSVLAVPSYASFVASRAQAQKPSGVTIIQPSINPVQVVPMDVLTGVIDGKAIDPLPFSVHPKARRECDAGPVPLDLAITRLTLVLRRSPDMGSAGAAEGA